MAKKATTIPTSLIWAFLMLVGIILLILMSRGWLVSGNAALSATEEVAKLGKCFTDNGWACIVS